MTKGPRTARVELQRIVSPAFDDAIYSTVATCDNEHISGDAVIDARAINKKIFFSIKKYLLF
jgi:hypothetical protein